MILPKPIYSCSECTEDYEDTGHLRYLSDVASRDGDGEGWHDFVCMDCYMQLEGLNDPVWAEAKTLAEALLEEK